MQFTEVSWVIINKKGGEKKRQVEEVREGEEESIKRESEEKKRGVGYCRREKEICFAFPITP